MAGMIILVSLPHPTPPPQPRNLPAFKHVGNRFGIGNVLTQGNFTIFNDDKNFIHAI